MFGESGTGIAFHSLVCRDRFADGLIGYIVHYSVDSEMKREMRARHGTRKGKRCDFAMILLQQLPVLTACLYMALASPTKITIDK